MKIQVYNCGRIGGNDTHNSYVIFTEKNNDDPIRYKNAIDKSGKIIDGYVGASDRDRIFNSYRFAVATVRKFYPNARMTSNHRKGEMLGNVTFQVEE